MALIKDQKTRYDIPHEEGEWVEMRPMRNGDLIGVNLSTDEVYAGTLALLEKLIVAWSYDDPPTPETVRMLDMQTTNWLGTILTDSMGSPAEKNGSTTSS